MRPSELHGVEVISCISNRQKRKNILAFTHLFPKSEGTDRKKKKKKKKARNKHWQAGSLTYHPRTAAPCPGRPQTPFPSAGGVTALITVGLELARLEGKSGKLTMEKEGRKKEVAKYEKAAGDLKNSSGSYQLLVPWYFSLFLPYECHIQHHIHLYQNIMPLA